MFTVTRQRQFPDGDQVVEVSVGSFDYCNPDCLAAKYPNEGEEFSDPREAVETAINLLRAWRNDSADRVSIGVDATLGMTLPFSPETFKHARAWAIEKWNAIEKCAGCSEPLPDSKRGRWQANDWDGLKYCSENCATRAAEFEAEETARIESDTDEN